MGNTQYINLAEYTALVEKYIYDRKGIKVRIVFDNPMRINIHFKALVACYDEASAFYKNQNNR